MDYFIGVEAEGAFKGSLSLFIASDKASPEKILAYLTENPAIKNVYFGAGGTCVIPEKYVNLIRVLCLKKEYIVCAEIDKADALRIFEQEEATSVPTELHVIFNTKQKKPCRCFSIKFESDDEIAVSEKIERFYKTKKKDILFELDKEVIIE